MAAPTPLSSKPEGMVHKSLLGFPYPVGFLMIVPLIGQRQKMHKGSAYQQCGWTPALSFSQPKMSKSLKKEGGKKSPKRKKDFKLEQ